MVGPITFTCRDRQKEKSKDLSVHHLMGSVYIYQSNMEKNNLRMISCPRLLDVPEIQFNSIQSYQARNKSTLDI